jgi:4-hydroxybenzoate polyprenyltransferase
MASDPKTLSEIPERAAAPNRTVRQGLGGWLRKTWRVLVYSSAYLSIIAMAKVLIVQYILSLPPSPAPIVGGLVTFAIYANDRLVDTNTDAASNPGRTAFVNRHRDALYVLAAIAYGLGTAIAALGGPLAFAMVLFPGAAWVMYGMEWVPTPEAPFQRVKEVLVVNSLLVAAAWSLSVVMVPLAFADATLSPAALVLILYFGLGTFVNTEIANASDIESDRRSGASTLPIALGIRRTRHALYGVTLLAGLVLGVATLSGYLSLTMVSILSVGLLMLLAVISQLGRIEDDELLVIAAECARLPVVAILLAVTFVV